MKHYNSILYLVLISMFFLIYLFSFVLFHCEPSVHAAPPSFSSFLLQLPLAPFLHHHPKPLQPHLRPPPPRPLSLFQLLVIMQVPDWLTSPAGRLMGRPKLAQLWEERKTDSSQKEKGDNHRLPTHPLHKQPRLH